MCPGPGSLPLYPMDGCRGTSRPASRGKQTQCPCCCFPFPCTWRAKHMAWFQQIPTRVALCRPSVSDHSSAAPHSVLPTPAGIPPRQLPALGRPHYYTGSPWSDSQSTAWPQAQLLTLWAVSSLNGDCPDPAFTSQTALEHRHTWGAKAGSPMDCCPDPIVKSRASFVICGAQCEMKMLAPPQKVLIPRQRQGI